MISSSKYDSASGRGQRRKAFGKVFVVLLVPDDLLNTQSELLRQRCAADHLSDLRFITHQLFEKSGRASRARRVLNLNYF